MQRQAWVGADPGGADAFGVAILFEDGEVTTACVSCADEAIAKITARPLGVGIDAPLWWSSGPSAEREADRWLRRTYGIAPGTVQTPNSLRGAALVQAAMLVQRLREKFSGVPITETHPKALAIALGGWEGQHLAKLGYRTVATEHERDAYLSAICAREGFSGRWSRDLSQKRSSSEQDTSSYWLAPIHYFWPEDLEIETRRISPSRETATSQARPGSGYAGRVMSQSEALPTQLGSITGSNQSPSSVVEIRDHVLWIKHIRGNPSLQSELLDMREGDTVVLRIDGLIGAWIKMRDSKSGASTPGLKPTDRAQDHWRTLFEVRRGATVEIEKA
jgi:predicted nuclease with RNAse H fold